MPSKASEDVDTVKFTKIHRIEAIGISFKRAFPAFRHPPTELGTNTLAAIEGVIKELSKRSLTTAAIEKSLGDAAQVWEGRPNRRPDRPTSSQFQGLLDHLRTPPKVRDPEQPVLVPGKRIRREAKKRGKEDGSDQWETEEEDSPVEGDSEEEEAEDGGVSDGREESDDEDSSETSEDGGNENEEEQRGEEVGNEQDTFNNRSHTDQGSDFRFTNIVDDQPPPDLDNISEERVGQDQSQAGPAHCRRRQKVSVVVPLPQGDGEESDEAVSIERGRGGQLYLSREFTGADNSLLRDWQHNSPEFELTLPIDQPSFDFSPRASASSPLTDLMARRREGITSQRPSLSHAKTSRPSSQMNLLRSDQDAAKQAVKKAEEAYVETETRLEGVLQSCTYTPPTYEFTCKEAVRRVDHRKRKAPNGDEGDDDDSGLESDDRSVPLQIAEQKKVDEQCIAREKDAFEAFKRRRIDGVSVAMKQRRGMLEKCAWARQMARAAEQRVTVESRYAESLQRYQEIDVDVQEPAEGAEGNGADHDTNDQNTDRNGYDGSDSDALGGSEQRGGGNGNVNGPA